MSDDFADVDLVPRYELDEDFSVYNLPRPLPTDTIPGFKVEVNKGRAKVPGGGIEIRVKAWSVTTSSFDRMIFQKTGVIVPYGRDEHFLIQEMTEKCIWDLKQEILEWKMENDETLITLQRHLRMGLNLV